MSQTDLGSLLRTAEELQIKGLAVPDDSPKSQPSPDDGAAPSVSMEREGSPTEANTLPPLQRKRKRISGKFLCNYFFLLLNIYQG